ncbi:MAG: HEAT repeat domain-containing protein [Actinomycetota bacterium]|nr:HEAT repeat domain-containing protein [Actinomycetota bacterium]
MPGVWGVTPRQSVTSECERVGVAAVVSQCLGLLQRGDVDDAFLFVVGGPAAQPVLDGREGGPDGYWPRVWALRALLYAWDGTAEPAVLEATADVSWRVREAAARVIARYQLDNGLESLAQLQHDPVPRVRTAAMKARRRLIEGAPSSHPQGRR